MTPSINSLTDLNLPTRFFAGLNLKDPAELFASLKAIQQAQLHSKTKKNADKGSLPALAPTSLMPVETIDNTAKKTDPIDGRHYFDLTSYDASMGLFGKNMTFNEVEYLIDDAQKILDQNLAAYRLTLIFSVMLPVNDRRSFAGFCVEDQTKPGDLYFFETDELSQRDEFPVYFFKMEAASLGNRQAVEREQAIYGKLAAYFKRSVVDNDSMAFLGHFMDQASLSNRIDKDKLLIHTLPLLDKPGVLRFMSAASQTGKQPFPPLPDYVESIEWLMVYNDDENSHLHIKTSKGNAMLSFSKAAELTLEQALFTSRKKAIPVDHSEQHATLTAPSPRLEQLLYVIKHNAALEQAYAGQHHNNAATAHEKRAQLTLS